MIGLYAVVEALTFGFAWTYPNSPIFLLMYSQAYLMDTIIPYGTISAFIKIIFACFSLLYFLPTGVKQGFEIYVSLKRIQGFLGVADVDQSWIQSIKSGDKEVYSGQFGEEKKSLSNNGSENGEFCVEMKNADFYWLENKKNIEENEKIEGEKNEGAKKEIEQSMLTIEERNTTKIHSRVFDIDPKNLKKEIKETKKKSFKISNFDLKLPKNKLIFVIGKVGSGKTSFLYSLLGEMNPTLASYRQNLHKSSKSENSKYMTQLKRTKKVAVLSQNSWIIGESIQENILLGAPIDQKKLKDCIEMSCFDKDLETMEKGL